MDHRIMVQFGYWVRFWSVPTSWSLSKICWLITNSPIGSIFHQSHHGTIFEFDCTTKAKKWIKIFSTVIRIPDGKGEFVTRKMPATNSSGRLADFLPSSIAPLDLARGHLRQQLSIAFARTVAPSHFRLVFLRKKDARTCIYSAGQKMRSEVAWVVVSITKPLTTMSWPQERSTLGIFYKRRSSM